MQDSFEAAVGCMRRDGLLLLELGRMLSGGKAEIKTQRLRRLRLCGCEQVVDDDRRAVSGD